MGGGGGGGRAGVPESGDALLSRLSHMLPSLAVLAPHGAPFGDIGAGSRLPDASDMPVVAPEAALCWRLDAAAIVAGLGITTSSAETAAAADSNTEESTSATSGNWTGVLPADANGTAKDDGTGSGGASICGSGGTGS